MEGKRRKLSTEFKTKVVLEALKERSSLAELTEKYKVSGTQISTWKGDFLKNAHMVLGGQLTSVSNEQSETQKLYSKIGQLQMENDFLKKALS
jgi:transposase